MEKQGLVSRRTIIKGAAVTAAASTFTIVKAESVRGTSANSMVEIGWVGNGGQGTRDAQLLEQTKEAKIVAVGDYFKGQADKAAAKFSVDAKRIHVGIDAYKEVIGSKVDAVLLTTPPGFRPEHFKAAVAAKKHVYAEKPLAVDVPGCHTVMEAGDKAKMQNLTVVVGLQRRYSKAYRAAKALFDQGAMGQAVMAHSAWDQARIWGERRGKRADWKSQLDFEIQHWYFFKWLCGDHIVEQNIHNIDVINWFMNDHPVRAAGISAVFDKRDGLGDIHDHFAVNYEYANGVLSSNTCVQVDGVVGDVSETIRGTKGTFTTTAGKGGTGGVRIEALSTRKDPNPAPIYKYEGNDDKHYDQEAATFVASVLGKGTGEDKYRNDTKYGVESTFTAILGRESAYRKTTLGWNELWNETKKLTFKPESKA
ncbi:MAG TPA: Gfo/Idh/MocA family oxidoreductase [Blastocatellia bacterium]|nr:Gfo/Idh/MocA family oxidoreductase [Blastocatellia bacterium]